MSASEEASVCRQGAGVSTLEYEVLGGINELCLATCWGAPKQEDQFFSILGEGLYDGISESFPSLTRMAECLMCSDAEACVKKKDSLTSPACEVATLWYGRTCFGLYLLKDVSE